MGKDGDFVHRMCGVHLLCRFYFMQSLLYVNLQAELIPQAGFGVIERNIGVDEFGVASHHL
jgi:succinate dehydrogenase/fumarate reductase cytochrome b subunit